MDYQYANQVAAGTTVEVPEGVADTNFEIDGTLLVAGSLTASEVGNSDSGISFAGNPPFPPPATPNGTLEVLDGGSASGIELQVGTVAVVDAGGELTSFDGTPQIGFDPQTYSLDQLVVRAGGTASNGDIGGGFVTVAGTATDLGLSGDRTTVSGTLSGSTIGSDEYPDHEGSPNVTTVQDGGRIADTTITGPGSLTLQLGATGSDLTLGGFLTPNIQDIGGTTDGIVLDEQAASTIDGLTMTGGSLAELDGYTGGLVVGDDAAAVVRGGLAGATVAADNGGFGSLAGIGADGGIYVPEYGPVPANYFEGLAISAGGDALGVNVTSTGLMAVQPGGMATDIAVSGDLAVFAGATVTDATLAAGSTTLLGGDLVYDGSGTTVDAGSIVQGIVPGVDSGAGGQYPQLFDGGVVQDGSGTLALSGDNSYGLLRVESGTVDLFSITAAGNGGVQFVEPANGKPVLETAKFEASAFQSGQNGTLFGQGVEGLGVGTIVDLAGQAYHRGDYVDTTGGETISLVNGAGSKLETLFTNPGGTDGLQFLALPDAGKGTDLIGLSTSGLQLLEDSAQLTFGGNTEHEIISRVVDQLASGGELAPYVENILGNAAGTSVGTFLQDEAKAHTAATIQAVQDLFSRPPLAQVPLLKA